MQAVEDWCRSFWFSETGTFRAHGLEKLTQHHQAQCHGVSASGCGGVSLDHFTPLVLAFLRSGACNCVARSKRPVVCTTYDELEATSFHINGWTWLDVACLRSALVKDRWSTRIVLSQHSGKLARKELRGSYASVKIFPRRAISARRQDRPSFQSVCAGVLSDTGCWQCGRTSRFHAWQRDGIWVWPVYGARTYWKFGDSVPILKLGDVLLYSNTHSGKIGGRGNP